jgi:hypothetical protein
MLFLYEQRMRKRLSAEVAYTKQVVAFEVALPPSRANFRKNCRKLTLGRVIVQVSYSVNYFLPFLPTTTLILKSTSEVVILQ